MRKISIIMPAYNEEATIERMLAKLMVTKLPWEKEIIVVNDGSKDKTGKAVKTVVQKYPEIIYVEHPHNMGKGAAVKTGISRATGDYVVIQDADLEYDPKDIGRMLQEVEKNPGMVVYGSRLMSAPVLTGPNKTPMILHYFGNRFLSLITAILYGRWLTDMETCYKLFPREATDRFPVRARGFEFEAEITAKLFKNHYQFREIPIATKPRGYNEGKKLDTWRDGWKALAALVKYRFSD